MALTAVAFGVITDCPSRDDDISSVDLAMMPRRGRLSC